jgi:aryl-alcohol dehydrogenase-like predicted oxidoreductase
MQYVGLGSTGLRVSRICLGTMTYGTPKWRAWVLGEDASRPFIRAALEQGINFFDTADMYSDGASEEVLGRALKDFARRDHVVVATKVFFPMGPGADDRGLSRKHILQAIDASLARLGMDYVDLYQIHRFDYDTPIEETMEALDAVVRSGKARHIGASSMFAWQFARMLAVSDRKDLARFVTMQNHYNLAYREEEREMLPFCRAEGIAILPWSPLARGMLTGNRKRAAAAETLRGKTDDYSGKLYTDSDFDVVERVVELAGRRGLPPARIALAWLLHQPVVTAPIIGASKPGHLEDAVAALDVSLSAEERSFLEEPYRPHAVRGHS